MENLEHLNSKSDIPSGIIKALSLKQPYAWLIANGYLLVDDRTWRTGYRGSILIHASKGIYEEYYDYLVAQTDIPLPSKDKLGYAGIVGIAQLILCARPDEIPPTLTREQRAHFSGVPLDGFGFLFKHAKPLTLMPCPGKLGIFEIDMDAVLATPLPAQTSLF
jgi:hypothetical protein